MRPRLAGGLILPAMLAACAGSAPPPPQPVPAPVAAQVDQAAAPQPLPAPPGPTANWRDAPLTAGTWRWNEQAGHSTASFGVPGLPPVIELQCDRAAGFVRISHSGQTSGSVPLALVTTFGTYPLDGRADAARPGRIVASIPIRDRRLDALAHSRGRFAIEIAGLSPSYLPSWPEVSRVVEDCR